MAQEEMVIVVTVACLWSLWAGLAVQAEAAESGGGVRPTGETSQERDRSDRYWIGTGQGDLSKGSKVADHKNGGGEHRLTFPTPTSLTLARASVHADYCWSLTSTSAVRTHQVRALPVFWSAILVRPFEKNTYHGGAAYCGFGGAPQ